MSKTMEKKSYGGPNNFGSKEMTKTVCSDLGKECEVALQANRGQASHIAETASRNTGNPGSNLIIFLPFYGFFTTDWIH